MKNTLKIALIILIGLIIIFNRCEHKIDLRKTEVKVKPSKQYKDKEGKQNAKGEVTLIANFKALKTLDSLGEINKALNQANSALKGKIRELLLVKNTVQVKNTVKTEIIIDTLYNTEVVYIDSSHTPAYKAIFTDMYHSIEIKASKDSTTYDLRVVNDLEISHSRKKSFLGLGKTKYLVNVRSMNPYTDTLSFKNYVIQDRPRRLGLGLLGGYGASKTGLSPIIGVGLYYKIF